MVMATTIRTPNRYDHGVRELVRTTRDVSCAVQYFSVANGMGQMSLDAKRR